MRLRRLSLLFRRQEGLSLIMAVGVLGVLSLAGISVVHYSTANARTSEFSKDNASAYDLAEAGINEMMAVLSHPDNNALNEVLLPETTHEYGSGTVTWSGTFNKASAVWSLTSIGRIKNPTGPGSADVTRKLTAQVPVTPSTAQPLNNPSWNYIMSTATGSECDMSIVNSVEVKTNLYVFGNLCLFNQAKVLAGETNPTIFVVNGKLTQYTSNNTAGRSDAPISEVTIAGGCEWNRGTVYDECVKEPEAPTRVFATAFHTEPATLVAPQSDWEAHYLNAAPGPYFPCTASSGAPPVWDSPVAPVSASESEKLTYRDNNRPVFNLLSNSAYSCSVAGGGSIDWNPSTKVLTVSGTLYYDGDLKIEPPTGGTWTVRYDGQATIYASGSLLIKNVKFCGGVVGTECDFEAWDPNTRMLVFAADGDNRQSDVPAGVSVLVKSAHFQGALYATHELEIDTTSKVDGPLVGSEVVLGQSVETNDFPTITTVPAGMPDNPTVYAQPNPPQLYSG